MLGLWFVMQYFVSFLVLQSSCWEREAGCFTLIVLLLSFGCYFLAVGCGLQRVIVAVPGHTHLLLRCMHEE